MSNHAHDCNSCGNDLRAMGHAEGCKESWPENLVVELEMWARHDPINTSVPFGRLFIRAAEAIKRLNGDLVDRIKGEQAAWSQTKELKARVEKLESEKTKLEQKLYSTELAMDAYMAEAANLREALAATEPGESDGT